MRRSIGLFIAVVAIFSLLATGCMATAPVTAAVSVPTDAAQVCRTHCGKMGLRLGAVVIILNSTGCVCEPSPSASSRRARSGGALAAGGAVIRAMQAEQNRKK